MTLRSSDLQSDSDLDSIRNSCDVLDQRRSVEAQCRWNVLQKCKMKLQRYWSVVAKSLNSVVQPIWFSWAVPFPKIALSLFEPALAAYEVKLTLFEQSLKNPKNDRLVYFISTNKILVFNKWCNVQWCSTGESNVSSGLRFYHCRRWSDLLLAIKL